MKTSRHFAPVLSLGIATISLWAVGFSAAEARHPLSGSSTVTRTGAAGNTSMRQSGLSTNGQGGYCAGSTLAGPHGNVATRSQSGSYNPATQTYSRSGTTTYPSGKQSNFSSSTQANGNAGSESRTMQANPGSGG
jgi:hypothetical protein